MFNFRNKFVDTLRCVFDEGSTMDESTIFPIPAELLVHIDTEGNNNPDLYQHKLIEDCELRAETLSKKMIYLQVKFQVVCITISLISFLQDLETNIKTAGTESN